MLNKRVVTYFLIAVMFILLIVYLLIVTLNKEVEFALVGDEIIKVDMGTKYEELGVEAKYKGEDLKDLVKVSGEVDTTQMAEYEIKYHLDYKDETYELTRYVRVGDNMAPTITLKGTTPVLIEVGEKYEDEGVEVSDNLDDKIANKVQIIGNVDTEKEGVYLIDYTVSDESGNTSSTTRVVYVVKDKDNIGNLKLVKNNEITYMKYTQNGIYLKGLFKGNIKDINLCKRGKCTSFSLKKNGNYYYDTNIDLTSLKNGTYTLRADNKENITTSLKEHERLYQGKIGDKFVQFNYDNEKIIIKVSDFAYEYDIVIDPGHGGEDTGAFNDYINEKELNLEQSLYEKKRYEEHGLKVLLLRDDLSYGKVMGNENYQALTRKAIAMGYYGSKARVTYSNHHNSNEVTYLEGWEILVPGGATTKDLKMVNKVKEAWQKDYPTEEKHIRVYARNYNEGAMLSKENKEMYYFTDYYALLRIPHDLFNFNNFIFEGCYLSNEEDYKYYYEEGNWQKLSEDKIKAVVEYLGKEYIP